MHTKLPDKSSFLLSLAHLRETLNTLAKQGSFCHEVFASFFHGFFVQTTLDQFANKMNLSIVHDLTYLRQSRGSSGDNCIQGVIQALAHIIGQISIVFLD